MRDPTRPRSPIPRRLPCRRAALVLTLLRAACASPSLPPTPAPPPRASYQDTELASWYGRQHQGLKTASGERFDMRKMTAAHRTLPLGTKARVTNLETGSSVVVTINDRGPYVRDRIIDLSVRAAQLLGIKEDGIARVRIE